MTQSIQTAEFYPTTAQSGVIGEERMMSDRDQRVMDNTEIFYAWGPYAPNGERLHQSQLVSIPKADRKHTRLVTERTDAPYRIVNLLGWTESIHTVLGHATHTHLAELNPEHSVSTEATYGIDGSTRAPYRKGRIDLEEMAEETLDTLVFQYEDEPLVITATSMAAAVLARMERIRLQKKAPLDIIHRILYEPCLTLPERSGIRMIGRFATHITMDYRRVQKRTPLPERAKLIADLISSRPQVRDLPMVVRHGWAVKDGTDMADIRGLARTNPTKIQGTKDCLKSPEVDGLEGFISHDIEGAGHAMGAIAVERATSYTEALKQRGLR